MTTTNYLGPLSLGTINSVFANAALRFNFRVITTSINAIVNIDKKFAYPGYHKMTASYVNSPNDLATRNVDIFLSKFLFFLIIKNHSVKINLILGSNETLTMPTLQYLNSSLNVSYSITTTTLSSNLPQTINYGDSSTFAFSMIRKIDNLEFHLIKYHII